MDLMLDRNMIPKLYPFLTINQDVKGYPPVSTSDPGPHERIEVKQGPLQQYIPPSCQPFTPFQLKPIEGIDKYESEIRWCGSDKLITEPIPRYIPSEPKQSSPQITLYWVCGHCQNALLNVAGVPYCPCCHHYMCKDCVVLPYFADP